MSAKTYDTRSHEQILAASHFAPFRAGGEINRIGLRELRTLDQFFGFAGTRGIGVPAVSDFLAFAESDTSTRRLDNLRTAFDCLLAPEAPVRQTIREAIRTKKPRSRTCNRISRAVLRTDPLMAPYHALPAFDDVALEDLRVLARFLAFTAARYITVPTVEDYLDFSSDVTSTRRLRSLQAAIETLLPGNPASQIVLAAAINRKGPQRVSTAGGKSRPLAMRRVPSSSLPASWQTLLRSMRLGLMPIHKAVPACSVIDSMEDILREYAKVQTDASEPVLITVEGVRRFEASRAGYAAQIQAPRYADQGNRPATRHTAIMRIRQFAQALNLDPLLCSALKVHEKNLRRANGTVVALKFGKLDNLPNLAETWALAAKLLIESANAPRRQTKLRLLNEAVVLALWTLLPLRLQDGQLLWGRDVTFDGLHYLIDIETHKEDEPLQGRLHRVLTPFLDALVLRGVAPDYLDDMRRRAIAKEMPMFGAVNGRLLSSGYPSQVWRTHMGTGANISRSRVHSELGQLGQEGIDAALALSAQRDESSRLFYQSNAVAKAQRRKGQDMVDGLLAEMFEG